MIGKYRGPKKGRPKGTLKPKTTIEELQKEVDERWNRLLELEKLTNTEA